MLCINKLYKSFGSQSLFSEATLQMDAGERLGLVGRNGYGKSTLFKIVLGEIEEDSGLIKTPKNYRIGHLAQHLHFTKPTILEEGRLGLSTEEEHDHYKVERILFGLGFTQEDMNRAPSEFSGGFQIRINLAKVLVSKPNLLLLDEPTNYLDIVSIRWITKFLNAWKNELILISHDREFMDSVTTHTALIHRQRIRRIKGPTAKIYALVEQEEETHEKTRLNQIKQRKSTEAFINRFRAQATKATAVQSRIKQLNKLPQLEELSQEEKLNFQFHYAPSQSKILMEVKDLNFSYEPSQNLISNFNLTLRAKDRIAIIGKNGKGKSTLLNLLAGELTPDSGKIKTNPNTKLGYFGQTNIERLHPNARVENEILESNPSLNKTEVRGICGLMMFKGDHAEKKIAKLSGGEKSRVMLGKILAMPANLLFLDEPSNHLDMESIEALTQSIKKFPGACVIVTHNEAMLRRLVTKLVVFHHNRLEVFNGGYDEFLEKIGWDEEGSSSGQPPLTQDSPQLDLAPKPIAPFLSKKQLRQKKATLLAQFTKTSAPLKKQIQKLEDEICKLESQHSEASQELIKASERQNVDVYVELSKKITKAQKQIDKNFKELEKKTQRLQLSEQSYQGELLELENS